MLASLLVLASLGAEPIHLLPSNPHYFEFRGKPTILVTSGEHYGAVLNLDFDHAPYLDELKARGLNLTRTFSGVYFEVPGNFNIKDNTLAPASGRIITPWARKGDKYDLDAWDDAYFSRLKGFVAEAGKRGIVVEYVLFCPFYEDGMWAVSPMNAKNNVNGVGKCPKDEAYTLKHPDLLAKQLAFVSKAVGELNGFDNVYFEVCNEPYFGGVTLEWQGKVVEAIRSAEETLANKHMIAQNIANGSPKIEHPNPSVSVFNLHYAKGLGDAANHALNRAIGDDETGFNGTGDRAYRSQAWEFLLDGGAVYSNLDYSFTTDHEDGSASVKDPTPGGGGPKLRGQLATLKGFVEGLPFPRMVPVRQDATGKKVVGLAEYGTAYAFYQNGGKKWEIALDVPASAYRVDWIDPRSGGVVKGEDLDLRTEPGKTLQDLPRPRREGAGGVRDVGLVRLAIASPEFEEDMAVRITARFAAPRAGATREEIVTPELRVSDNKRFLQTKDGKPFFYLGDTAWELFHRLDAAEMDLYLKDRASKGFTVIQAALLAELDGLHVPNREGEKPLIDDDPTKPNEKYFAFADRVIRRAGELGLYIGVLPTWGDKVNKKWGVGPEIFSPENARAYGEFLGRRYRDAPNIIWVFGGDRPSETDRHRAIWRALADGIKAGEGGEGRHLITYHTTGSQSSSSTFHDAPWLDFNMIQSGHSRRDFPNYDMVAADYARKPPKPTLDGEPRYEDHPINFKAQNGWFDAFDVRKAAYWAVFAGACGHTYGCHDIWQFWQKGRAPITAARTTWREALALPGSTQVGSMRRLVESRPYFGRIPDQSLVVAGQGSEADHVQAARDESGSYALIYIPNGKPVTVDLGKLSGDEVVAWWFDPRSGASQRLGTFPRSGRKEFTPPKDGPDWVLVLDDASRKFPEPGAKPKEEAK